MKYRVNGNVIDVVEAEAEDCDLLYMPIRRGHLQQLNFGAGRRKYRRGQNQKRWERNYKGLGDLVGAAFILSGGVLFFLGVHGIDQSVNGATAMFSFGILFLSLGALILGDMRNG